MISDKKTILFGAGNYGKQGLRYFGVRNVHCFADNNKHGRFYLGKRVISFAELQEIHSEYNIVITAGTGASELLRRQCDNAGIKAVNLNALLSIDDFESDPELRIFKNKHEGSRCFLIGNGPSLKATDLDKIHAAGDVSFGCNSIQHIFQDTPWRPEFYVAADNYLFMEESDTFSMFDSSVKLLSNMNYDFTNDKDSEMANTSRFNNVFIFNKIGITDMEETPRFSEDPSRCLFAGVTVMYYMIQWAAYMGFKEIFLLGVDCTPYTLADPEYYSSQNHFYDPSLDAVYEKFAGTPDNVVVDADIKMKIWTRAYTQAETYSRKNGFRIYNATRGGHLEAFERIDFDSLF